MKKLAFVVAFALLALTLPGLAAIGPAPVLKPRCYTVHGTACSSLGATKACTDACGNSLSCTCVSYAGAKYWWCQYEC